MYDPNANASPFNSVPPAALSIAMVIAAVEIVMQLGAMGFGGANAVGWRLIAIQDYGFYSGVWHQMWAASYFPLEHMIRFVTYPFVHGGFMHTAFACVIVLAIGKAVGEVFSMAAFYAIFFGSAILAALLYSLVSGENGALIGAYPGGYGLIGAFTFLLWTQLAAVGADQRQAFQLIGFLLAIQLVFGLLFGAGNDWIADVMGFLVGFGMSFVVSPGGWNRVLSKIRKR